MAPKACISTPVYSALKYSYFGTIRVFLDTIPERDSLIWMRLVIPSEKRRHGVFTLKVILMVNETKVQLHLDLR